MKSDSQALDCYHDRLHKIRRLAAIIVYYKRFRFRGLV